MKTRPASPTQTTPTGFTPIHWFMMVLGVLTAITCLFVLSGNIPATDDKLEGKLFRNPTPVVIADIIKATSKYTTVSIFSR